MSQAMTGKYYLGRKVVDNYGRTLGKVVGYYAGETGSPPLLGVELLEGDFNVYPSTHLIDEANILVLDENWKRKAEDLSQSLSLNERKISALDKLYKSGEISREAYDNLGRDFDLTLENLKKRRQDLIDRLDERSNTLSVKLKEVEDYFVNVKVGHELGEMDDEAYRSSRDALHDLINRLQTEQNDLRAAHESLQRTYTPDRNEYSEKESPAEPKETPSEVPIVLRIKEAEE